MKCFLLFAGLALIPAVSFPQGQETEVTRLSSRHYQIIPAPASEAELNTWRVQLHQWKDSLLNAMHYQGTWYTRPEYTWASKAYSTLFVMANDRTLYDQDGHLAIIKYLNRYEAEYGGVDNVLLWATYPQLGFDSRDQFFFYRNLPGGTTVLKKLGEELHTAGKKLFIAYNPWDDAARRAGKDDESELIKLVADIGADGIFLDTITAVDGFFEKLRTSRPGAIFQAEIATPPDRLDGIHQAWLEIGWSGPHRHLEFEDTPPLVRNRWLEQRHMIYRLSRWSHEQSAVFQNAWMNGCGVVIWENIFGTINKLNPRNRSLLRTMLPIQRRYSDYFTRGYWTPLVPTLSVRVYASSWEFNKGKLWTLVNRQEESAKGKVLETEYIHGMRYFDLVDGDEVQSVIQNGKATIFLTMKPRAIGCILEVGEKELTPEFYDFLGRQKAAYASASENHSYDLPDHRLIVVNRTKAFKLAGIPAGMKYVAGTGDSVKMEFDFTKRECGFYPMNGFIDQSYSTELNVPGSGWITTKVTPLAMDETLVTNRQYAIFLKAAHYHPADPQNFLRNWVEGKPPRNQEDHPVTWISLDDARAYAVWAGKRLPTESEWQWAAQNGNRKDPWPWGSYYDSTKCNHGQYHGPTPVKKFDGGQTQNGLYDMSGNVWQLTESERSDGNNVYWILRGGSWFKGSASIWYADQGPRKTNFGAKFLHTCAGLDRCATVGFRCVVDVQETSR